MKVLVASGSSGGHIFPSLAFIDELRQRDRGIEALLILSRRASKNSIEDGGCRVRLLPVYPMTLAPSLKNLCAAVNFLKSCFASLYILAEFRPDYVVGFGTLDTLPIVFFAWFFRIKTLIHEQNVVPGRANRVLAKLVDKVAISFVETKGYLKIDPRKIVLTGNPLRRRLKRIERQEALGFFGFSEDKFTLLVMGGSLGSSSINRCFLGAVSLLPEKSRLQVIHIAGEADSHFLERGYRDSNIPAKVFSFLKEMEFAYSCADLAVCRAGATTISELIFFRVPAVIIPYPFAHGHQKENSAVLRRIGAAVAIEESRLSPAALEDTLGSLMGYTDRLQSVRSHYEAIALPDAAGLLCQEVMS